VNNSKQPKAYPSFLAVVNRNGYVPAYEIIKAASETAAVKQVATLLEEDTFPNFDVLVDRPSDYNVTIYKVADEGQVYDVVSAGITLQKRED
jgi:hypothetical protein